MPVVKDKIVRPNLILCEGEDALYFIIEYLDYLEKEDKSFYDFQAMPFNGNEALPQFLKILPQLPGYNIVKSITIIRDAEKDPITAKQSVSSALKNHGFSAPSQTNEIVQDGTRKIAFVLFPTLSENTKEGTLEDLYVKNLVESPEELIKDIDVFINGLKEKGHNFPRIHKSRLRGLPVRAWPCSSNRSHSFSEIRFMLTDPAFHERRSFGNHPPRAENITAGAGTFQKPRVSCFEKRIVKRFVHNLVHENAPEDGVV